MKLAVSNIAWDAAEEEAVLALLERLGVQGVEIAPTKLWPELRGATPTAAAEYRARLAARGFQIPALQAILFGRPELLLFGPPDVQQALVRHVASVAELAHALGAGTLVFGSPKNRDCGDLSWEQASRIAAEVFAHAGDACLAHSVRVCLEPNPKAYACNFMTHWYEVEELVQRIAHPGVAVHLDAACIAVEGDDPVEAVRACAARTAHFHVTEPSLQDFSAPTLDHQAIGRALRESGYAGWLSIEMRRSAEPLQSIEQAVTYVLKHYS